MMELDFGNRTVEIFDENASTVFAGPLALTLRSTDGQRIARTAQAVSRDRYAGFLLVQPRDRPMRLSQYRREETIMPGDCALLDGRQPFTIESDVQRDTLFASIPTVWLMNWIQSPEDFAVRPWRAGHGWGGILTASLAMLHPASASDLPSLPSVLCDQIGSLLAMASREMAPFVRSRPNLFERLCNTMRGAFASCDLTPAEVARRNRISLRSLHLQFASNGTTFGAALLGMRLEAALQMLQDQGAVGQSVRDIAVRCGFRNASHFARRFREQTGRSPSEIRSARGDLAAEASSARP